jgi:hypothetical protein
MGMKGKTMKKNELIVPSGMVTIEMRNVHTGKITRWTGHNLVTTAGKTAMADALRGNEVSNRGIITYCAMGTSAVAPNASDTALTTEIGRKAISVRTASGNVATFQIFFTTAEVNGVLREAGLFGDSASDTANSGTLFCKTAINRTKTSADTLTLSWAVTIG